MNNKKIYYIFFTILISILFGCKNNHEKEKINNYKLSNTAQSKDYLKSSAHFSYNTENIKLTFLRKYDPTENKTTIKEIRIENSPRLLFNTGILKYITISYYNTSNTIEKTDDKIEISDDKKTIAYNGLMGMITTSNDLITDKKYLEKIGINNFNYNSLKELSFMKEDFLELEKFLLELIKICKELL